jgi:hypothetical protein
MLMFWNHWKGKEVSLAIEIHKRKILAAAIEADEYYVAYMSGTLGNKI